MLSVIEFSAVHFAGLLKNSPSQPDPSFEIIRSYTPEVKLGQGLTAMLCEI